MDKVQKIRKEVEKLKSNLIHGACSSQVAMETRCKEEAYNEVLSILYTMQEEPVSIWHDMSEEAENGRNIIIIDPKDFYGAVLRKGGSQLRNHNKERYVKWAYIDDIIKLSNVRRTTKNCKEPVSEELEIAANEWNAKASFTPFYMTLDDNGNPNGVTQDYTTHAESFKAGAKWQKNKMMEDATDVIVHIDAGGYPYIPQMELYDYDKDVPLAKEGDKYKVVLIKEG